MAFYDLVRMEESGGDAVSQKFSEDPSEPISSVEEQAVLDQLVAGLEEANDAADRLILQMELNISVLRDATLEAEMAAAILRNSNDFALARLQEKQPA